MSASVGVQSHSMSAGCPSGPARRQRQHACCACLESDWTNRRACSKEIEPRMIDAVAPGRAPEASDAAPRRVWQRVGQRKALRPATTEHTEDDPKPCSGSQDTIRALLWAPAFGGPRERHRSPWTSGLSRRMRGPVPTAGQCSSRLSAVSRHSDFSCLPTFTDRGGCVGGRAGQLT